jgi:alpha 1,2-mannosyltransferase
VSCFRRLLFLGRVPDSTGERRTTELTDAKVEFGLIPHDHWYQPSWIDEERAKKAREDMVNNNVIYGGWFFFLLL